MSSRVCWILVIALELGLLACGLGCPCATSGPSRVPDRPPGAAIAASADRPDPGSPVAPEPAPPRPVLAISPANVALEGTDPGVQFRVERVDGERRQDVTDAVAWATEGGEVIAFDKGGFVRPTDSGAARLTARLGDLSASASIAVQSEPALRWNFAQDVLPRLTRAGCNTGGCHARAEGQGGFHLSLYGFDPVSDYDTLTRQAGGRRVNMFDPDASLLLQKASGRVAHGGGLRLPRNSAAYALVKAWIAAGAAAGFAEGHGPVASVAVEPDRVWLAEPGARQLRIVARSADGHVRDVTRLASYRSNDEQRLTVSANGQARLLAPGQADVIVRYQSFVVPVRITSPLNPGMSFRFPSGRAGNPIDRALFPRLQELNVPPSPPSTDAAFLRRVSLDLTGQLPEPDEIRAFLADTSADKRTRKIDELLAREDHLDFWALKLGDLLQVSQARFGAGAGPYQAWIRKQLRENRPWNALVQELLTATGDPLDPSTGGPVNYALDGADPQTQAEQTARRFLGLRLRCAQCHDHPFDVWTQDDYYGFAAFFAKVDRGTPREGGGMMSMRPRVGVNPAGTLEHPRTRKPVDPRPLDHSAVEIGSDADPRRALAEWMTQPSNPYFACAYVNWVWAQFFGRGLVNPADDMSAANPPVHPQVLEALARDFVESGYDSRKLLRAVAGSDAYGLSSQPVEGNAQDHRFFSHHEPHPLTAHQMADALAHATQVPNVFANRSARSHTKAIQVFDPGSPSILLDTFGRCSREIACSPVGAPQLSLGQALFLIGGDAVDGKVSNVRGYLSHLLELEPAASEIVDYLYFRTLCRPPTEEERTHWASELAQAASAREAAEDLFWALLNSREFAFNH